MKTEDATHQSNGYGTLLFEYMQQSSKSITKPTDTLVKCRKTLLDMRCEMTCTSHYICGGIAAEICTVRKAWGRVLEESSCLQEQLPSTR
jgi:hypothetical protein